MKNIVVSLLLSLLLFGSCSKEAQPSELEVFRSDKTFHNLRSSLSVYQDLAKRGAGESELRKQLDAVMLNARELIARFGYADALRHARDLVIQNAAADSRKAAPTTEFDKCKRNADGTTNWEDCGFYESLLVSIISAFECNQPAPGASQREIEGYYDCVQSVVCRNC